jgi:branched-chain amino acid transport system substrate-binding protein
MSHTSEPSGVLPSSTSPSAPSLDRRTLLGAAAAALAFPSLSFGQSRPIKIGYVTALSGVRAPFGVADNWHLAKMRALLKDGIELRGKRYPVEILLKDNQSEPTRSQQVVSDLILREKVDLMLVQDNDATHPAGQLCDVQGIPLISTMAPWQSFIYTRNSTPEKGFPFSFTFFWGADDVGRNFVSMWNRLKTNKTVGTMYADNSSGQAFADAHQGMPAVLQGGGYSEVNSGIFKIATDDFSNQVALFKNRKVEIVSGFMFENHFATFWKQAQQAGFRPEACTAAAAFLFPSSIKVLGDAGNGMSTEVWWTPSFPFKSSLTGQSARQLAEDWEKSTGNQWTQPLGYAHALWEVGIHALRTAADPLDRKSVRDAIRDMTLDSIIGKVDFRNSPIKSVAKTAMVGGQWQRTAAGSRFPFDLQVVDNPTATHIPTTADLKPLSALR